ncbi:MAG TPA: type I-E CRISPR-associated protein Cse2/CasB [Thermoleophilaceae bacterium]|jgi:septal ring factor EnvC (AmiA/AmiB activator)|nr:type I-E CRISPR-associated protein Cse2/CasB [Thermoleophilaceae bacterium]
MARGPEGPPEDERPVQAGDLRSLRRWLIVGAVWATAATAIAVIALIAANNAREDNTEAGRQSARTAGEIGAAQRRLDQRLDEIESRLDELASADDVSELETRLKGVEDADTPTVEELEELSGSVDDLEKRLETLEEAPADGTETTP